jgi:hypothetical protein
MSASLDSFDETSLTDAVRLYRKRSIAVLAGGLLAAGISVLILAFGSNSSGLAGSLLAVVLGGCIVVAIVSSIGGVTGFARSCLMCVVLDGGSRASGALSGGAYRGWPSAATYCRFSADLGTAPEVVRLPNMTRARARFLREVRRQVQPVHIVLGTSHAVVLTQNERLVILASRAGSQRERERWLSYLGPGPAAT